MLVAGALASVRHLKASSAEREAQQAAAALLKAKFAEPRILMLPEARHHLANELPGIRQRYFDFIGQRLG